MQFGFLLLSRPNFLIKHSLNTVFCDLCVLALKFCSSPVTCWERCLVVHHASLSCYAKNYTCQTWRLTSELLKRMWTEKHIKDSHSVQEIALYYRQRFYTVQCEQIHYEPYRIWLSCLSLFSLDAFGRSVLFSDVQMPWHKSFTFCLSGNLRFLI